MTYEEITGDLFSAPEKYYLAHCISNDFALGAGIAVQFNKRFNMRNRLKTMKNKPDFSDMNGYCILCDKVFNLVTKDKYWQKPTYGTLTKALLGMKTMAGERNITNIAMPMIGCGLDGLEWDKVSQIIQKVFEDTEVNIKVYKL